MSSPRERSTAELSALVPRLPADANKYTRGVLVVAGGSAAYPGAPVLAARAASRCGAGYVRLAVPHAAAPAARAHVLSIPVTPCAQTPDGGFDAPSAREVLEAGAKADAFVVGPGMGAGDAAAAFVAELLCATDKPLVLDADALNVIAAAPQLMEARRGCVNVLTPHAGEAARLLGSAVHDRTACARELAERFDAVVVLKGPGTLVAGAHGGAFVDGAGGPELAKAGSGDVLGGMIGAFLTQRLQPLDAASLAVYLHGRAGALAVERESRLSVVPEDIIDYIGPALVELAGRTPHDLEVGSSG